MANLILQANGNAITAEVNQNPPMKMRLVYVTKELADYLLARNPRNRTIKRNNVEKMKNALRNGAFEVTHQGIALDGDMNLIDGQNRLTAISETGVGAWMYVFFNAPRSAHLDKGVKRSYNEGGWMAGLFNKDDLEHNQLTSPLVRYTMERSFGVEFTRRADDSQIHNAYKHHEELFGAIISLTISSQNKWGKSSVILYAMLRALNAGVNIEDIKEWYSVFTTGKYLFRGDERKTAAAEHIVTLRQILEAGRLSASIPKEAKIAAERKVMASINHFVNRYPAAKIYGSDVYPDFILSLEDVCMDVQGGKA